MTDPVEIVLAAIRAVEQRDSEALTALCHAEVEFHDAPSLPYGGERRGSSAVSSRPRQTRGSVHGHPCSPRPPSGGWTPAWSPRTTVRSQSLPPTRLSAAGERFDAPVFALYHVRDGKFARAQMFHYDTAAILAFLDRAR